jgi:hypothetical protein
MQSPGSEFARALAAKDFERAGELLAPDVDFRALTPRREWHPADAAAVVADVLPTWFDEDDHIEELVDVTEGPPVSDRERISWRLAGHNGDGPFVLEQQAYYSAEGGRIVWIRVLCSGFRPAG